MPIFDRETTKHSPRSPRLRHHSGDAFQRDANAKYGMGISRGHSPTACQLRKHRNTRAALQVAGSTHPILHSNGKRRFGDSSSVSAQRGGAGIAEGAIHEPKPSAVFKDAESERDEATNLPPKPMDYSQGMSFVDLTEILFSQTGINHEVGDETTTMNAIKCLTSKMKLVFKLSDESDWYRGYVFDVYIVGFFGIEGPRKEGHKKYSPQIPLIEVVEEIHEKHSYKYISINNRRLYLIHALLYALAQDYAAIQDKPNKARAYHKFTISKNIENFKTALLKHKINVQHVYCPVAIYAKTTPVPRYIEQSYRSMNNNRMNTRTPVTWGDYLSLRFKMQRGCCNKTEFTNRGLLRYDKEIASCPLDKETHCDRGIIWMPTFAQDPNKVLEGMEAFAVGKNGPVSSFQGTDANTNRYREMVENLLGVDYDELLATDSTVVFVDIPPDLKRYIAKFYETTRCLKTSTTEADHATDSSDWPYMQRYRFVEPPAMANPPADDEPPDCWENLGGHMANHSNIITRKSHRHSNSR
jgi:hypothetical protein